MDSDKKLKHFIKQPTFKGGNEAFTKAIYTQLRYPEGAIKAKTEGIVYVEYDIDYTGSVIETRVIQGIGHGCDEEACRVLKTLKFDVVRTRGVKVLFHRKAKIQFRLPKPDPIANTPQLTSQIHYQIVPSQVRTELDKKPIQYSYTIDIKGNT
jgi:TonB family protein